MFKGISKDAAYYALIGIFLIATIYLLSPALFRQSPFPSGGPSVITGSNNFSQVNLTVLFSSNCKAFCDSSKVEASLKDVFVNLNVKRLDVETTQGKALANQANVSLVPAYVFDSSVTQSPAFPRFGPGLVQFGGRYVLDTAEASSGYLFTNEPSSTPAITQFVASFDLNSILFQNKTFEVLKRFNNSINFTVRYIVVVQNNSFHSVNGKIELIEDVIQLCAVQSGSPNALNAIACRSREIRQCLNESTASGFCAQFWQTCIGGWGIDTNETENCVRTQNQTMLFVEADSTADNKVTAVPTTIIGNQYRLVGQATEFELFSNLCAIYPSLPGCVIRISDD